MIRYKDRFPKQCIGFSDHTIGTHTAVAAVSLGAKVIEKHFTLNEHLTLQILTISHLIQK